MADSCGCSFLEYAFHLGVYDIISGHNLILALVFNEAVIIPVGLSPTLLLRQNRTPLALHEDRKHSLSQNSSAVDRLKAIMS
jgi:hypothetical protein